MSESEKEIYNKLIQIPDKFLREKEIRAMIISNESVERMNKDFISKWNGRVNSIDSVIFNGDFSFRNSSGGKTGEGLPTHPKIIIKQLNGNIIFMKGNHDRNSGLRSIIKSMIAHIANRKFFVTHNPRDVSFNHEINIVGHVHEKWRFIRLNKSKGQDKFGCWLRGTPKDNPKLDYVTDCINVSCDVQKFYPRTTSELMGAYNKWKNEYEKE